jgi:hypothetical protein
MRQTAPTRGGRRLPDSNSNDVACCVMRAVRITLPRNCCEEFTLSTSSGWAEALLWRRPAVLGIGSLLPQFPYEQNL